jgi:hypothetical protein
MVEQAFPLEGEERKLGLGRNRRRGEKERGENKEYAM